MKKIILLYFGILVITGCTSRDIVIPSRNVPRLIAYLNIQVDSADDAKQELSNWLNSETNFDSNSNKIIFVDEYTDYFNIRLTTAIIINGRNVGYRDYKLNKDGTLYGYDYWK